MAENGGDSAGGREGGGVREGEAPAPRPTAGRAGQTRRPAAIALPPRSSLESFFGGGPASGTSPGPLTLVSSFFAEDSESECGFFTQLLFGAINSPAGKETDKRAGCEEPASGGGCGGGGLAISQLESFTLPLGLSPRGSLLGSPQFSSSSPTDFAMSHQEVLAQVTAQAARAQFRMLDQADFSSPSSTAATTSSPQKSTQKIPTLKTIDSGLESEGVYLSNQMSQHASMIVDKPADDGYNWRKYGQKVVKGSEYPRSYYKCTHPNCPVKKKIERSVDGQVIEIIYKGQHNHQHSAPNKRANGTSRGGSSEMDETSDKPKPGFTDGQGNFSSLNKRGVAQITRNGQESGCWTLEQLSGSSDNEEVADIRTDKGDDSDRVPKRRNMIATSQRTLTEPRIIVQTTSEVDLLDDGFRWRKYGQKVVKGNPYPRSYYKCTYGGCSVRKHIERSPTDPKAIITTYEGKHVHDVPAARNSRNNASKSAGSNKASRTSAKFTNYNLRPAAASQLKEEHENT